MRKYAPAIAVFLFGQGVSGVLAYFENTIPALVLSITTAIAGAGLGVWSYRNRLQNTEQRSTLIQEFESDKLTGQVNTEIWMHVDRLTDLILELPKKPIKEVRPIMDECEREITQIADNEVSRLWWLFQQVVMQNEMVGLGVTDIEAGLILTKIRERVSKKYKRY